MTITSYDFEAGTNNTNVATGGGITAVAGSPPKYQAAAAATASAMGVQSIGAQWLEIATPATDWSGSMYFTPTVNPGSGSYRFISLRGGGATLGSFRIHSSGAIGIVTGANVLVGASATTTWTAGDAFRFDWQMDQNGANVDVVLRIFKGANISGTTPDETVSRTITGITPTSVRFGGLDSGAFTLNFDNISLSDTLEWIGPYIPAVVPLDTPVVTVTVETNPTTSGGNDGSITCTWPAVDDADHYVAEIATGHDQTTGFTLDDATATSPHTFTGLTAGNYTVSIIAEPA
jgi:hypothetical protein